MRTPLIVASFIALSSLTLPALAESGAADRVEARADGAHGKHGSPEAKRARRTQALRNAGVDDARAKQVVALMEHADAERKPIAETMRAQRETLKKLVSTKSNDEAAYGRALDSIRSGKQKLSAVHERETQAIGRILKPSEQARLLAQLKSDHRGKAKHEARARSRARNG